MRLCPEGRPRAAGFLSSRGSSSSRDSLREDATPDLEEDEEVRGPGELDARLASSNESRGLGCRVVYAGIVFDVSRFARQWRELFLGII